jgi:hypothetical protein
LEVFQGHSLFVCELPKTVYLANKHNPKHNSFGNGNWLKRLSFLVWV